MNQMQTPPKRQTVKSSQALTAPDTQAQVDPARTVAADGEDRGSVWVAVVGHYEDVTDTGAKRLAARYAFDGRPDVGVDRFVGPTPDDGTVQAPVDASEQAMSGVVTSSAAYRQMAAAAALRKRANNYVVYYLVRPGAVA